MTSKPYEEGGAPLLLALPPKVTTLIFSVIASIVALFSVLYVTNFDTYSTIEGTVVSGDGLEAFGMATKAQSAASKYFVVVEIPKRFNLSDIRAWSVSVAINNENTGDIETTGAKWYSFEKNALRRSSNKNESQQKLNRYASVSLSTECMAPDSPCRVSPGAVVLVHIRRKIFSII